MAPKIQPRSQVLYLLFVLFLFIIQVSCLKNCSFMRSERFRQLCEGLHSNGNRNASVDRNDIIARNDSVKLRDPSTCSNSAAPLAREICAEMTRWRTQSAAKGPAQGAVFLPGLSLEAPMKKPTFASPEACLSIGCICPFMGGLTGAGDDVCQLKDGSQMRKALRKEYRQLTDQERTGFHEVLKRIKHSGVYDSYVRMHSEPQNAPSAHVGPGFLPWHREYLKRFEILIRMLDPGVALPYWDSTLDEALPEPKDSVLWSAELLGATDSEGVIESGPCVGWKPTDGKPSLTRYLAKNENASLFKQSDLDYIYSKPVYQTLLAYTFPVSFEDCPYKMDLGGLEYVHGKTHFWVNGHMRDMATSPNDPVFFLFHSFVDYIWETYRQRNQTRFERENQYPEDRSQCAPETHFGNAQMEPFERRNVDGLSNKYTDHLYEYQARPSCSKDAPTCGSAYLHCDIRKTPPRCVSKVKIGGNCTGYNDDICYRGKCVANVCQKNQQQTTSSTTSLSTTTDANVATAAPASTTEKPEHGVTPICYNGHQCCQFWASRGECSNNPNYMLYWCSVACEECQASYLVDSVNCTDHHSSCSRWEARGECRHNAHWMSENCRRSCGLCGTPREAFCSLGGTTIGVSGTRPTTPTTTSSVTPVPSTVESAIVFCFDEYRCCGTWLAAGRCSNSFLATNCVVSCRRCTPDYLTGGKDECFDYHRSCRYWAGIGECQKNAHWMTNNCRKSCATCQAPGEEDFARQCGALKRSLNITLFDKID